MKSLLIHTPAKFTELLIQQGLVRFVYCLIHTPAKFTEWLIQQGLVRFIYCFIHTPAKFTEWLIQVGLVFYRLILKTRMAKCQEIVISLEQGRYIAF